MYEFPENSHDIPGNNHNKNGNSKNMKIRCMIQSHQTLEMKKIQGYNQCHTLPFHIPHKY